MAAAMPETAAELAEAVHDVPPQTVLQRGCV
jgi:hypothetical protein